MAAPLPTIALFAKYPVPGQAKTRLIPALGAEGASDLHRHLVERTVDTMRASDLPFQLWTTGADHAEFRAWLGDDVALVEQSDGDLGARLAKVPAPAILLGADIPDISPHHLLAAAEALAEVPVVIGPASDGGYYLLAFREPMPFLWDDMPWGTERVRDMTEARLNERGIAYHLLGMLDDCDRPEDLPKWPDIVP